MYVSFVRGILTTTHPVTLRCVGLWQLVRVPQHSSMNERACDVFRVSHRGEKKLQFARRYVRLARCALAVLALRSACKKTMILRMYLQWEHGSSCSSSSFLFIPLLPLLILMVFCHWLK